MHLPILWRLNLVHSLTLYKFYSDPVFGKLNIIRLEVFRFLSKNRPYQLNSNS